MPNSIKVMDIEHALVVEGEFTDAKSFGIEVTKACYNDATQIIMYQPNLSKSLLKYLKDQVRNHNGAIGTSIRTEESKMLPDYIAPAGGGYTKDTSSPEYWNLRNNVATDDVAMLDGLYQTVVAHIDELVKASGINKSQVVFYLRTKNQKGQ